MCLRKTRHSDEMLARLSAVHLFETKQATVDELFVYRCPNCRGWHLTKNKRLNLDSKPVTATDMGY